MSILIVVPSVQARAADAAVVSKDPKIEIVKVESRAPASQGFRAKVSVAQRDSQNGPELLSYAEFQKLDLNHREMYVAALRELLASVAEREAKLGVQYEVLKSAGRESLERTQDLWTRVNDLQSWVLPQARAKIEDKACVYAGWLSVLDLNGKYCEPPKSDGCVSGSVQCNPLVFGAGVCTPRGVRATSTCIRNAKPIDEIVKQLAEKKEEWESFKSDIDSYCERGRQGEICALIKGRLKQMDTVAHGGKPEALNPISKKDTPKNSEVKFLYASRPEPKAPARPSAPRTRNAERPRPQPAPAQAAAAQQPQDVEGGGRALTQSGPCDSAALFAPVDPPEVLRNANFEAYSLLSFQEAQALMCGRGALSESALQQRRARSAQLSDRIKSMRAPEVRHHRELLDAYRSNFDVCLQEARQLRASGSPGRIYKRAALSNGDIPGTLVLSIFQPDGSVYTTGLRPEGLGLNLMSFHLGVCDVVDQRGTSGSSSSYGSPSHSAPSYSSPSSGTR